jgi:PilZ domain-containing protein
MEPASVADASLISGVPSDKRSCPRYPFSSAVEVLDTLGNTRIIGRLSDIARHGCYVDTISPFAAEAAVKVTIMRERQVFKTDAKVVYTQVGMGMGLMFTTAEPEHLQLLGAWLDELAGGKPHDPGILAPEPQPITESSFSDHQLRDAFAELVRLLGSKKCISDSERVNLVRNLAR